RFVARTCAGEGAGHDRPAARGDLQRRPIAFAPHGDQGRIRRRRALPGVAAPELPAPDDRRSYAAGVRRVRYVDRAFRRWLPVSHQAPRGPFVRRLSSERRRGRNPLELKVFPVWAYRRLLEYFAAEGAARRAADARSAAARADCTAAAGRGIGAATGIV